MYYNALSPRKCSSENRHRRRWSRIPGCASTSAVRRWKFHIARISRISSVHGLLQVPVAVVRLWTRTDSADTGLGQKPWKWCYMDHLHGWNLLSWPVLSLTSWTLWISFAHPKLHFGRATWCLLNYDDIWLTDTLVSPRSFGHPPGEQHPHVAREFGLRRGTEKQLALRLLSIHVFFMSTNFVLHSWGDLLDSGRPTEYVQLPGLWSHGRNRCDGLVGAQEIEEKNWFKNLKDLKDLLSCTLRRRKPNNQNIPNS